MIRRLNELMLSLLTHASLPLSFWVDALHTATYLHNILPTKLLHNHTPTSALYLKHPTYDHLRIFGCACYPNLTATRPHKLAPRSTTCVFLGYPPQYRGYRCLDLSTGRVILSRHVTFDESTFPYTSINQTPPTYPFQDIEPNPIIFQPSPSTPNSPPPVVTSPTNPVAVSQPSATQPTASQPTPSAPSSYPFTYSRRQKQPAPPPPTSIHPMTTRSRAGISKSKTPLNLHSTTKPSTISPLPKSHNHALTDPNWSCAMTDEYRALMDNNTWELMPRPPDAHVIRCMWIYRHKFHANGSLA